MNKQLPILLVVFNRPEKTRRMINALRKFKPARLFVAADAPRSEKSDDVKKCQLVRQAITAIDWPCDILTRFLTQNAGCGVGVSSAITWFFTHVKAGIILEDDCIPHPHFIQFCAELLDRYALDQRIMGINGLAPYPTRNYPYDYHFSRRFRCHGWATWRRAWNLFSYDCDMISETEFHEMISAYYPHPYDREPWINNFKKLKRGDLKTWAFRYEVAQFSQNGLFIAPEKNLITNIGFDEEGTNTCSNNSVFANLTTHPIQFPLKHPPFIFADDRPERSLKRRMYRTLPLKSRCAWRLRHLKGTLRRTWKDNY